MRIIKKLGAIALAATMMMSSVMVSEVRAEEFKVDKSDKVLGRSYTILAQGNTSTILATTSYTSGSGSVTVQSSCYKYNKSNPKNVKIDYKEQVNKSTPYGATVVCTAGSDYYYYSMESKHRYVIYIDGDTYTGDVSIDYDFN